MTHRDTTTHLSYGELPADGSQPHQWINPPPEGTPRTNVGSKEYVFEVRDLRAAALRYGLDATGFDAVDFSSKTTYETFADQAAIERDYYPEIEELLKQRTGGHRVHIFDNTVRRTPPKDAVIPDTPESRQPVSRVHVDQTPQSAIDRVRRHLGDDAEELLKGRVRLINVWKPLRGPVKDIPLAVADFNTMDVATQLVSSDLIYSPERIGRTFLVKHSPAHKWYYLSDQQPNEALLLKCFDSASLATPEGLVPGIAALTPHTAFEDEEVTRAGYDGPRRESIEVRALVFG